MSSPPKPINRTTTTFFAESNRIATANNAHFLTLFFLFFFPLFISLFTFLHFIISQSNPISLNSAITITTLVFLFALSLYVAGVATITHSTQQSHYGKPFNLSSTFDSITKPFFPLASTTLASGACLLLASISFLLFSASFLNALKVLGFNLSFSLTIFIRFRFITFVVIILLFLVSFHVHLTLAAIISMVESKWGFEPLRRSFFLVQGMKRSSLSILLLRGISIWVTMLGFSTQIFTTGSSQNYYLEILQIVNISMFWTIFMSSLVIQYTVLYLYCKDFHEESGFDIATEISKECVALAINDSKFVRESNVKFLVLAAVFTVGCAAMLVVLKLQII